MLQWDVPSPLEVPPGSAPGDRPRAPRGGDGIELAGISRRILPLPVPPRDDSTVLAVAPGTLIVLEQVAGSFFAPPEWAVHRFDLRTRQSERLLERVSSFDLSADGAKMLYRQGDRWAISPTACPPTAGGGTLKTDSLAVRVVPRAEWRQMYHEVWRIARDFFYDPGMHGLNLKAAEARYAPYVEGLASRADLNYLFYEMLTELSTSHIAIYGGDVPDMKPISGGLLGADYVVQNGRYRFARVYRADPWDPGMSAPLVQPGSEVKTGDYLLAVNGQDLTASDNVYRLFEGTAGKPTVIRVGLDPGGAGSREIMVTPLASELDLRMEAWIEQNRRTVEQLTNGRVAYIYIVDTLEDGYDRFNRQYYAQIDKEAAIIDERFNLGGALPIAMVDRLSLPLLSRGAGQDGAIDEHPPGIYGPKALLINEYAGSGGDALALYFREMELGPIVGKRTWGGLAGAFESPPLMDGGVAEVPTVVLWGPGHEGEVENHGVAPDTEVEFDPEQVRKGHDPQLEAAIRTVMAALRKTGHGHPSPGPVGARYYPISSPTGPVGDGEAPAARVPAKRVAR